VTDDAPVPVDVTLRSRELRLAYGDGTTLAIPAELLRVWSPSAEVRGHGPGQRKPPRDKGDVRLTGAEPVGHYALRLVFDDGHDSGLYTWALLHELGADPERWWRAYREEIGDPGGDRSGAVGTWRPDP
jgi:DUF971 family protein